MRTLFIVDAPLRSRRVTSRRAKGQPHCPALTHSRSTRVHRTDARDVWPRVAVSQPRVRHGRVHALSRARVRVEKASTVARNVPRRRAHHRHGRESRHRVRHCESALRARCDGAHGVSRRSQRGGGDEENGTGTGRASRRCLGASRRGFELALANEALGRTLHVEWKTSACVGVQCGGDAARAHVYVGGV